MALNDKKMSELELLPLEEVTDETIFVVVKDDINYKLPMSSISTLGNDLFYASRPLGEISLTTVSAPQTFDDSAYTIITAFDKIQFERGVDCDLTDDSITLLLDANYSVSASAVAEFDKLVSLDLAVMVDGVVVESFGNIQGLGVGKGVTMGGTDIDPMVNGAVIQLAAKRGEAGTVDVVFSKARLIVGRV